MACSRLSAVSFTPDCSDAKRSVLAVHSTMTWSGLGLGLRLVLGLGLGLRLRLGLVLGFGVRVRVGVRVREHGHLVELVRRLEVADVLADLIEVLLLVLTGQHVVRPLGLAG